MKIAGKFEKVSQEQFKKDWLDTFKDQAWLDSNIREIQDGIELPKRSTTGSCGYDFMIPYSIKLPVNASAKIPTGIRCKMNDGWLLMAAPRSGLGFKYFTRFANTVGIIDSDYYNSENEGHIFAKIRNEGYDEFNLSAKSNFMQGIFLEYGVTLDDNADGIRNGGFGSTDN